MQVGSRSDLECRWDLGRIWNIGGVGVTQVGSRIGRIWVGPLLDFPSASRRFWVTTRLRRRQGNSSCGSTEMETAGVVSVVQ